MASSYSLCSAGLMIAMAVVGWRYTGMQGRGHSCEVIVVPDAQRTTAMSVFGISHDQAVL
jgi:hypothetical protein